LRSRRTLLLWLLWALLMAPGSACPFCSPVEADLFSELQEAQAAVLVSKVDTQKYKILKVIKGTAPLGKIVLAGEPRGKAGAGTSLLLTTAGPTNLPYWSDAPRYLNPAEMNFVSKALTLLQSGRAQQWDFAAANLEKASPEVATAASRLYAAAPLAEVQKRAGMVGPARLVGWVRDQTIPAERRALYLLMVYPHLSGGDAVWLKRQLFESQLPNNSPLLGPYVVAYLQVAGVPAVAEVEKRFLGQAVAPAQALPVTRALALVGHHSRVAPLKTAVKAVFLREVAHPRRGPFAIAPLAVWKEYKAAPVVEKMASQHGDTWVRVAVIRYFRSFSGAEAQAALQRLARLDVSLVERTRDPYKVTDLGIE
jgi:hypothetical protein